MFEAAEDGLRYCDADEEDFVVYNLVYSCLAIAKWPEDETWGGNVAEDGGA